MSTAMELRSPAAATAIGQATAVEQSRAVAEVQAQVVVAQRMPRDIDRAVREMKRSCSRRAVAEKAFYRFPRGGQQVSGESITLATELARCWGNLDYGIAELRRDDVAGESEMMAYAWDLETNTRPRTTFIVPHLRDKKGGGERLTDARDIYENNANMGSRRVREMIFRILPPWFIEDAKDLCYKTLAGDGGDVAERAALAAERFARIGVRPEQLVQKLGAPVAQWAPTDLATLAVIWKSIERGETTAEAEFGAAAPRISPDDLAPAAPAATPDASPAGTDTPESEPAAPPAETPAGEAPKRPQMATEGQVRQIRMHLERLGYTGDRDGRLRATERLARLPRFSLAEAGSKGLERNQAAQVITSVQGLADAAALAALLDELAGDPRDEVTSSE